MSFAILATDELYTELKESIQVVEWIKADTWESFVAIKKAIAYFDFSENIGTRSYSHFTTPVFINAVDITLKEINNPGNACRILAWPTFLKRNTWEVAGNLSAEHVEIIKKLGKNFIQLPDEPGMVSARVISMIINEAYFALENKISTKEEIDIAMKLGTNYPYGPFEWSNKIGLKHIYNLLKKLSIQNEKYTPSSLLKHEALVL